MMYDRSGATRGHSIYIYIRMTDCQKKKCNDQIQNGGDDDDEYNDWVAEGGESSSSIFHQKVPNLFRPSTIVTFQSMCEEAESEFGLRLREEFWFEGEA